MLRHPRGRKSTEPTLSEGAGNLALHRLLAFPAEPCDVAAYTLDGFAADDRKDHGDQGDQKKYFLNHLSRPAST